MILAGTSERGCCPECGAPWERETEAVADGRKFSGQRANVDDGYTRGYTPGVATTNVTLGWLPTCDCFGDGRDGTFVVGPKPVPCTVLDPFGGSGTTALVARNLGRSSVLIELNADYCALAASRLSQQSLLAPDAA